MLDSVIVVLMITSTKDVLMGLAKLIANSKCSDISCCGCKIKRDVQLEETAEEFRITHPIQNQPVTL